MTAIFVCAARFVRPTSAMDRRSAFVHARVILVDGRDKAQVAFVAPLFLHLQISTHMSKNAHVRRVS